MRKAALAYATMTDGLYANAILPAGNDYTFWGKGVSQGHSDAIRRIFDQMAVLLFPAGGAAAQHKTSVGDAAMVAL